MKGTFSLRLIAGSCVAAVLVLAVAPVTNAQPRPLAGPGPVAQVIGEPLAPPVDDLGPVTRAQLLTRANHLLFDISLADFISIKNHAKSALDGRFDWNDNGCSAPWPAITATWSAYFDRSCARHDFGYRNLGHGLALGSPSAKAAQKAAVDSTLLADMRHQCEVGGDPVGCGTVANAFYYSVTHSGQAQTAFFAKECPSGWLCLFDDTGYEDRRIALQSSEDDMNDIDFGDKSSSAKNSSPYAWVLYDDHDYEDRAYCLPSGWVWSDMHSDDFNDKISSAKRLSTANCS